MANSVIECDNRVPDYFDNEEDDEDASQRSEPPSDLHDPEPEFVLNHAAVVPIPPPTQASRPGSIAFVINPDTPVVAQQMSATHTNKLLQTYSPSSAEQLGQKSGKEAYFAREENKLAAFVPAPVSTSDMIASSQTLRTDDVTEGAMQSSQYNNVSSQALVVKAPHEPTPTDTQIRASHPNEISLAASAWSSSGEKFLNSPPAWRGNVADLPDLDADGLDMTSAYQFEQSKIKAARAGYSRLAISEIIESPVKPAKRKAEEMSLLTPEEELFDATHKSQYTRDVSPEQPMNATQEESPHDTTMAVNAPIMTQSDETSDNRPTKRLKRVVEAVGYLALGGAATGVALLSALIATAPTFT
jgi:hypothetical protein